MSCMRSKAKFKIGVLLSTQDALVVGVLFICFVLFLQTRRAGKGQRGGSKLPSPPGALPFVGHLRLLPKERPWVKLKEWSDQLGAFAWLIIRIYQISPVP